MPSDFVYPTAIEIQAVAQTLVPRLVAARPVFDIFPLRDVDSHLLEWEQRDTYTGLQQVRGLNGQPPRVKPLGARRFLMNPGVYGERMDLDEQQLTMRRNYGSLQGFANVTDLVRECQDRLLGRRLDRIEWIIWTLLVTGTFSVLDGSSILHTDSYTTKTFTAGTAWGTAATSTPLADLRAVQLLSRGISVDFGARATLYMNRTTMNQLLSNTNANDMGGRRVTGLQTVNGPVALNQVLSADDLPGIVVYDQGYLDDNGTFQLYIPNNKAVLVGSRRDGDPVGEFRLTRNANNPGMAPGAYMKVIDDEDVVPRTIQVHDGMSGGVVLFHPGAIVLLTV